MISFYHFYPKVADCVCLMALDKTGVIPVDTHVWQIASQYYMPHLKGKKSVTKTLYDDIGKIMLCNLACLRCLYHNIEPPR